MSGVVENLNPRTSPRVFSSFRIPPLFGGQKFLDLTSFNLKYVSYYEYSLSIDCKKLLHMYFSM